MPRARSTSVKFMCILALAVSACGGDVIVAPGDGADAGEDIASTTESIISPTPPAANQLLAVVRVTSWLGLCTGTLIAPNRVLTAAHCVCTQNLVGGNVCQTDAEVEFRPNPATGMAPPRIAGKVTAHPDYNPSWVDKEIENDIAIIALNSFAPTYVTPVQVATSRPALGVNMMIAGYGHTGSGCSGAAGSLNYAIVRVSRFVDDGRMAQFDDEVTCHGDSGGPLLDTSGLIVYAVTSNGILTASHGWVNKSILVQPYLGFIRSLTCSADVWDRCDHTVSICRCGAGIGDCDTDSDCAASLHCAQDVGAYYHYDATVDVCIASGSGAGCPTGQFCCEPGPAGTCGICRPSSAYCP